MDRLIILYLPVPRTHEDWGGGTLSLPITMVAPPLDRRTEGCNTVCGLHVRAA